MSMVGIRSLGFVVAVAAYTVAQSTEPIAACTNSSYLWTYNSLSQSPCEMTAWLGGVCNGGVFNVPTLETGLVYLGPTESSANACRCSSVFYSLISACALCQSDDYLKWSAYNGNCSTVYPGIFPYNIPNTTKIPSWAYLDVVPSDQFLPAAALAVAGAAESTFIPSSTSATTSSSRSSTSTSVPTTSGSSSGTKKSNAGAIAGGVVGAIVGLALVAALVFWWTRRRRARPTSSAVVDYMPAPMTEPSVSPAAISFNQTTPFGAAPSPKLYDPSDPSTFPSSPVASTTYTTQDYQTPSQTTYQQHPGTLYPSVNQGPRYTGAPEL